jgi:polar amino acid transport system permease protein
MFEFCADPSVLPRGQWFACYLTTGTHLAFYRAFVMVLLLLALVAPLALAMGIAGALAARAQGAVPRALGSGYIAMVRGIPDIVFFLFVPIAIDQAIEYLMHQARCPDWAEPVRRGADFIVCPAAKVPQSVAAAWVHHAYAFAMAVTAYALVFGAFAANTLKGAMDAVPRAQIETAEAYGMTRAQVYRRVIAPQMWVFALPGLSNIWMILIKATPLLFLLGIQDIVYWARELGGAKTSIFAYPHPDWRLWYFLALLGWYLALTAISEGVFSKLHRRLARGLATAEGEALRRAEAG